MKRYISNNIYLIPPIMIIATFASHIVEFNYIVVGNILGYSILTSLPMIYIFWLTNRNYCWFTKLSCLALPLMNLIRILGAYIDYERYTYIFDLVIISITVLLSIIFTIQKK